MDKKDLFGLILSIIAIISHSVGFSILWITKQKSLYKESQRFFLLHQSFVANLHSFLLVLMIIFKWMHRDDLTNYVFIISAVGTFPMLVFILISMTFDRFLTIFYGLDYVLIWNKKRSKILILFEYLIVLGGVSVSLLLITTFERAYFITLRYIWLPIHAVFGVFAISIHSYMLSKVFHQHDLVGGTVRHHEHIKKALLTVTLSTFTFILFISIPDIISFVYDANERMPPPELTFALYICYRFGLVLTAFIYVYDCSEVRIYIQKTIRRITQRGEKRESNEMEQMSK